jgi:hypothetical protein
VIRARPGDLVAFLGPSLSAADAARVAPCRVLPPARAGDVYAILAERPLAVALVDGVFEDVPSVWHREILAALDAGIAVFGGASMGALRAAELDAFGMVGVGAIYRAYRDGDLSDDSEVALLHAGPGHGHRALTVPLVTVRTVADAARAGRVLSRREARAVVAAAERIFWQDRTWPAVAARARLAAAARARLDAFLPSAPDPKAADARACLEAAAAFVRARRAGAPPPPRPVLPVPPSHARRARLAAATAILPSGARVRAGDVLAVLARRPDARRLAADGLRRALLASVARAAGLVASGDEIAAAERAWLANLRVAPRDRDVFLAASALDEGEARRVAEDLALQAALLDGADRAVADGPSWEEGLALGARLTGAWAEAAAEAGRGRSSPRRAPRSAAGAEAPPAPSPRAPSRGLPGSRRRSRSRGPARRG